ncbi:hypothetical protein [Pontiella sp.]|uniref:hypothetical protein n=1 Tax=Pontiella sp. TaxID=2837462 RepID=UPI00356495C9
MKTYFYIFTVFMAVFAPMVSLGVSTETTLEELIATSKAICRATALNNRAFEKEPENHIYTATGFKVEQTFKGTFGATVEVQHRGGDCNGRGEHSCRQPIYAANAEYLLFIAQRDDGSLYCVRSVGETESQFAAMLQDEEAWDAADRAAGIDVSSIEAELRQTAGLAPGYENVSSRFLQGDRGEPIEYVVDMDAWPPSLTKQEVLAAVRNAFDTWAAATSLTFTFAGIESFGMASADLDRGDGRIYVQVHDLYDHITDPYAIGDGGRTLRYMVWDFGGIGGRIGGNEFDLTTQGYVVIDHTKSAFTDPVSFEEVVCHEIGHTLSLAHSSEDDSESDATLTEALMYYLAHLDGRGASLRSWDTDQISTVFPADSTPPYGFDRKIYAIYRSSSSQPSAASGVNSVRIPMSDRQGGAWPHSYGSSSGDTVNFGTFSWSIDGDDFILYFTPTAANYEPADATELTGDNEFYEYYVVRFDDLQGNVSPPIWIRVVQLLKDANLDNLADSWVGAYPGTTGGTSGDPDGDGFSNLEEWFLGTAPNDKNSALKIGISENRIHWNAKPMTLYQLETSADLTEGFSALSYPIQPTSASGSVPVGEDATQFFRIRRFE